MTFDFIFYGFYYEKPHYTWFLGWVPKFENERFQNDYVMTNCTLNFKFYRCNETDFWYVDTLRK